MELSVEEFNENFKSNEFGDCETFNVGRIQNLSRQNYFSKLLLLKPQMN